MTQLIVLGTRRPDSDEAYGAYVAVAGPLLFGAGGTVAGQYARTDQLAGTDGPQVMLVMDFPDEASIRGVFDSAEYAAAVPDRDAAFESIDILVAESAG